MPLDTPDASSPHDLRGASDEPGPVEDFRIRTARQRRARTSRRLCEAALASLGEHGLADLTVEDIRARAGLSRGAIYRYFPTLEALLDYLGAAVGAQLNAEMTRRFDAVPDPALQISLHLRYQATRVVSSLPCAIVAARRVALHGAMSDFARTHALRNFTDAAQSGRFDLPSVPVAVDLAHGMLAAILRRAVVEGLDEERLRQETGFLLRACGMSGEEAYALAAHPMPPPPAEDLQDAVLTLCSLNASHDPSAS